MRRVLPGLLAALALAGCTLGPDYVRPPVPEPAGFREGLPADSTVADLPWWEMYGDPVLVDLIRTCLENNQALGIALGRIDEARAQLGIVRAGLYPRLDYVAEGNVDGNTVAEEVTTDATALLRASWQIDLWGRIRRSNEAALQALLATEEAYRGLTITLVAEVASAYLTLRDLDNRLAIAERTLETWRNSNEVIRVRFEAGMISEVDVNQSDIQVASAEVSVQTFLRLRAQVENALSVLLGVPPGDVPRGLALSDQRLGADFPTGLPSTLLRRRPDVLEAERLLHAQTARIGAAEALKFPQFNLLADLGGQFTDSDPVGFFGLTGQILGPLFNSGENQRRVEVEEARTRQLILAYEAAILGAYREVDDAMVALRTYQAEYDARVRQVAAAGNAASISWDRYETGLTSYLEVLDLQRSLFNSQLGASEALQARHGSVVRLYQALGGGWTAAQDTLGVFRPTPED
jgi:multidrug efflux system outer membrane protein